MKCFKQGRNVFWIRQATDYCILHKYNEEIDTIVGILICASKELNLLLKYKKELDKCFEGMEV